MIKLKDILNERSAYLPKGLRMSDIVFHGRNPIGAEGMLKSMELRTNAHLAKYGGKDVYGVSTSRTFEGANKFGHIIFLLDKNKIKQKYRLKPFDYFHFNQVDSVDGSKRKWDPSRRLSKNEFEDIIITAEINDAFNTLVGPDKDGFDMTRGTSNFRTGKYNVPMTGMLKGIQFGLEKHNIESNSSYSNVVKLALKKSIPMWGAKGLEITKSA